MEQTNQNFMFINKLSSIRSKEFETISNFRNSNIQRSAGGDICMSTHATSCSSKNSSLQNLTEFDCSDDSFKEMELSDSQMDGLNSDESKIFDINIGPKAKEINSKFKTDLLKYKQELGEYTKTTNDLEEKYMKINLELNKIHQQHNTIVAKRNQQSGDFERYSEYSSTSSEYNLQRKYTQTLHGNNSSKKRVSNETNKNLTIGLQPLSGKRKKNEYKKPKRYKSGNDENEPPFEADRNGFTKSHENNLKNFYRVLKTVLDGNTAAQQQQKGVKNNKLQSTISYLEDEQDHFRTIIEQQQNCLQDYHTRCVKADNIMSTQQEEIEKLNSNNHQLEKDFTTSIDQLRLQIETKLREVSQLPLLIKEEKAKNLRALKENSLLHERIRVLQAEANKLKIKIEEIGRRKGATMERLKAAERDLKIFKNYNTALKHEKRKLNEELHKIHEQMNGMQNSNKRTLIRQREQNEKRKRELQKRIFELEIKLNRSQNSTTGLIRDRDSLISELQTQLNTLVHNFEVSQKHIRVLRRHIYSMSGGNTRESIANNRILSETT